VIEQAHQVFADHAPETKPWFQLDRGGDAWPVLLDAVQRERWVTIRAAYNRRVAGPQGPQRYLREVVESQSVDATYELLISRGSRRGERTAKMAVRYSQVPLDLLDPRTGKHHEVALWAVSAKETETCPADEKPLEWLLLTTYPVTTAEDAMTVVNGYTQRWRIEEFHKVWKTGACRVEEMQLRAEDHAIRWATILASVGVRLLRLAYIARTRPDAPATEELTAAEVQAIIVLRNPKKKPRATPCIADAVYWLAKLGGYTGKSSGGPPGPLVVARGLSRVEPLAFALGQGRVAPV
jgi:hypothetical protein